jgi:hypothetical protein
MTDKFSISRNKLWVNCLFLAGKTKANGDGLFLNLDIQDGVSLFETKKALLIPYI